MAKRTSGDGFSGTSRLITSAVVIFIVVLLGIFVVVTRDDGKHTNDNAAAGANSSSGTSSSTGGTANGTSNPPASGSGCHPTDTDTSLPTTAPGDVNWELVKTVALPRSKRAGPLQINGMTAGCYAHTPRGALMAAINDMYRVVLAAPDVQPLTNGVVAGPGRDILQQHMAQVDQGVQPGQMAQVAGFRMVSYTSQSAVVALVNGSQSDGTLKVSDTNLQWQDGDWKIVAGSDGALTGPANPLADMSGYVLFGGV